MKRFRDWSFPDIVMLVFIMIPYGVLLWLVVIVSLLKAFI